TRWTPAARREIRDSRINGTALISRALAGMRDGPSGLVQASAIGFYGPRRPGELLTEADRGGEGVLADLVRDWEGATRAAAGAGVRAAAVRTGLALTDGGGPLPPQLPLFLAGAGGRLTDAEATVSWISLDDIVRSFAHAALSADLAGPVNGVGPQPVSGEEFARTPGAVLQPPARLTETPARRRHGPGRTAAHFARTRGAVLHRPALLPVPPVGPRLVLGGAAADELIRTDQEVSDARLRADGFEPAHRTLEQALRHVLRRSGDPQVPQTAG